MTKRNKVVLLGGTTAALLFLMPGGVIADENDQDVDLAQLPAAVRATAEANAQGGTLVEAELETEDGQQVYSVEVKKPDGGELEIEISPDGKLLEVEAEDDDKDAKESEKEEKIELSQAPAEVQAAAAAALKDGAELKAVVREQEHGKTVFEVEYTLAGVEHSLEIAENGALLEQENEVTTSSLPAAVSSAVQKAFPKGQVTAAEEITVRFYELEIRDGNKTREIKVLGNGKILKGDDNDDEDDDDEDEEENNEEEDD